MKNEILDIIIALVKGVKGKDHIECDGQILWSSSYLLNQVIRQYSQPNKNYFISEKALNLWKQITSEDIMDKYYQDKVTLDKVDGSITLKTYKGSSNSYNEWTPKKGDKLTYRDVFHDDHIVPIKVIIENLVSLEELSYENVKLVLGKIRVCKMLKEEDRSLKSKSKRPLDYNECIEQFYKPKNIVCINAIDRNK